MSAWMSLEGHKWGDDVQVWFTKKNQTTPTHKPFFCHTEYCRTPFPHILCLIWCSTMSSRGMGTSLGVLAAALVGWAWGVHPWWMCSCVSLCSYAIFIGIRGCFHVVSNMQTLRQCALRLAAPFSASPGLPAPRWPRGWWCLRWLG